MNRINAVTTTFPYFSTVLVPDTGMPLLFLLAPESWMFEFQVQLQSREKPWFYNVRSLILAGESSRRSRIV